MSNPKKAVAREFEDVETNMLSNENGRDFDGRYMPQIRG